MGLIGDDTNSELFDRDDFPPGTEDAETQSRSRYQFEDRFRVDRRKLESMLMVENGSAAEKFFKKLPINGPRCKKDPQVRVCGTEDEDVRLARDRILEVLDPKGSRVSLKIDVSYTDHSHIIGRGGCSIQRVMNDTNCLVHFPDSNKASNSEKSNQVSIAGELPNAEYARSRVRVMMPILVSFSYETFLSEPNPNLIQSIEKEFGVQVTLRPRIRGTPGTIMVKGSEDEITKLKNAVYRTMQELHRTMVPVTMTLEVTPFHHSNIRGKNDSNIRVISGYTGARLGFPEIHDPKVPPLKKSTIIISGGLESVLSARHLILGAVPIIMCFDVRDDLVPNEETLETMAGVFGVCIVAKSKPKQSTKTIIVKAPEKNIGNVYEVRRQLLNLWEEPIITAQVPPTYMLPPEVEKFLPLYTPSTGKGAPMFLDPRSMMPTHSPLSPSCFLYPTHLSPKPSLTQIPVPSPPTPFPGSNFNNVSNSFVYNFSLHDYLYGQSISPSEFGAQTVDRNTQTSSCSSSGISSPTDDMSMIDPSDEAYVNSVKNLEDLVNGMTINGGSGKTSGQDDFRSGRSTLSRQLSTPINRTPLAFWADKKSEVGQAIKNSPVVPDVARTPTPSWSGLGFSFSSQVPLPSLGKIWEPSTSQQNRSENEAHSSGFPSRHKYPVGMTYSNIADSGNFPSGFFDDIDDVSSLLWKLDLQRYITTFAETPMAMFLSLDECDLYSLGVTGQAQRNRLLLAIKELRQRKIPFNLNPAPGAHLRSPMMTIQK
ncbi:protein bicaudal C-like isoform X2 [Artemia franciscana]|uniref:protein bicaudal C-like isoform X2 n=1 Tax=Artemia franciscana TaxID=6661 RepID=UPI0032D9E36C